MEITFGTKHNLPVGTKLKCIKNNDHGAGHFTIGKIYSIVQHEPDRGKTYVLSDMNSRWYCEEGQVFATLDNDNRMFSAGDLVVCTIASGHEFLKENKAYIVSSSTNIGIKLEGNNTRFKNSRFVKATAANFSKAKSLKDKLSVTKDKTYRILRFGLFEGKITATLKIDDGTTEQYVEDLELIPNKKKKVKPKKLDATKMHEHNCLRCEKQLFPKLMCKCNLSYELPF